MMSGHITATEGALLALNDQIGEEVEVEVRARNGGCLSACGTLHHITSRVWARAPTPTKWGPTRWGAWTAMAT